MMSIAAEFSSQFSTTTMTNTKGGTLMFRQGSSPGEWLSFLVTLLIYANCTLDKGNSCAEPQHRLTLILRFGH